MQRVGFRSGAHGNDGEPPQARTHTHNDRPSDTVIDASGRRQCMFALYRNAAAQEIKVASASGRRELNVLCALMAANKTGCARGCAHDRNEPVAGQLPYRTRPTVTALYMASISIPRKRAPGPHVLS